MTITQLEYFCALCRFHSVTKAAEELNVSQPTISIAIRNLEKELEMKLLHHSGNAVSLTEEGERFFLKASDIVRRTQDLYSEFSAYNSSNVPIRLGIPPMMSTIFFPLMLDEFHKHSDIPVHLFEYGSGRARDLVNSGDLDLALVNMDFYNIAQFESLLLMTDRFVYCVSDRHPLAGTERISLEELANEKIILYNTDSIQNEMISSKFAVKNIRPDIVMHVSQLQTIENCLYSGTYGAFLFSALQLNRNCFHKIEIEPMITSSFGLIWKKNTYLSQRTERFIRFARTFDIMNYR